MRKTRKIVFVMAAVIMGMMFFFGWSIRDHQMMLSDLQIQNKKLLYDLEIEKEKIDILACESGFKHEKTWGDHGKSFGIAQFQQNTFNGFKQKSGHPKLNWMSRKDQLWLLDWALRNDLGKYWSCYKKRG